jgi:delta24(24(1))-sterol reductase
MAATKHANGNGNGKPNGTDGKALVSEAARARDKLADTHTRFEFGGPLGVSAMMTGFPLMMCTVLLERLESFLYRD